MTMPKSTTSERSSSHGTKLKRASTSRKSVWHHFGFTASSSGQILSRKDVICCHCSTPIPYSSAQDATQLFLHLSLAHPEMAIDFPVQSTVAERDTPTVTEDVERVVILDEVECDAVEYLIENVMDIEDEHVDDVKPSIDAEPSNATQEDTIDICETLADMCIGDLISPEIVDGPGFKRLIKELDYKCEVPSSQKIWDRIHKISRDSSEHLPSVLDKCSTHYALTIDAWINSRSRQFYSVSLYFQTNELPGYSSLRNVESFTDSGNTEMLWKSNLWFLDRQTFSAAIVNFEADSRLTDMLRVHDVPMFTCFSTIINRIVSRCFRLSSVQSALRTCQLIFQTIDNQYPYLWLTQYAMIVKYMDDSRSEWKPNPGDQTKIAQMKLQSLVDCLAPFKVALETVQNEQHPLASLIQPLGRQLLANYFDDCDRDKEIDAIVREEITNTILTNEFLSIVSFLDPRFHNLLTAAEVAQIKPKIQAMCPADQIAPPTAVLSEGGPAAPSSAVGLSFFFNKKLPVPKPFDAEFQSYLAVSDVQLDQRPQDWWKINGHKYPHLQLAAKHLLCTPAMLDSRICTQERLFKGRASINEYEEYPSRYRGAGAILGLHSIRETKEHQNVE